MTSQRSILGCALVAAAATAALLTPTAAASPATTPGTGTGTSTGTSSVPAALPGDFDGNGFRDIAVAAPSAQVGQARQAGAITVLYGSQSGAVTARKQTFHQDSPGIPGDAEEGDRFGTTLTTGDLDGDGYTDLVVGAPGEDYFPPADHNQGMLTVLWGGGQGLTGEAGAVDGAFIESRFGDQLVAGDFDSDGDTDLVVNNARNGLRMYSGPFLRDGTPAGMNLLSGGGQYTSWLELAAGDLNGDGRTDLVAADHHTQGNSRSVFYWLGRQGRFQSPSALIDGWGNHVLGGDEVAVGDVDNDGRDEILIGRSRETLGDLPVPPGALGGRITVAPGSAQGPRGDLAHHIHQDTAGVPGTSEAGDGFGSGLAVADLDGDGYEDVTAGVPGEDLPGVAGLDQGAVVTLWGGAGGLTGTGALSFNQNTAGVPGAAEEGDAFGRTTGPVDTDGDGKAELFTGAPGENLKAGAVWAFDGTATGPAAQGSVSFGPHTVGIHPDAAEFGSAFND
ncbi:FG-GAP-like repeat-containing protein [Streptomyces yaizuensis]|uniref:FG-GAP-like repeat-containing protein n=1 Tax=Streptomyces yaizuensis TaxID=2989713 RepID=A0ABQ5NWJ8_9ACTN|nr:FG-GAP-like repeat-containing protein [Streptomyces sp. YSPA8]GLF94753.1 FG-GAP-like repeat-containing protein [Streptomyces sp. YSPA8]